MAVTGSTLVFGPTGNVGSAVALGLHERGAGRIFLAMRDTSKPIPDLSPEVEKAGNFERVQADLSQPETLKDIAAKTGAKKAFLYVIFGSPDNLRASIEALHAGGVEFAVLLSSAALHGDRTAVPPTDFIPWIHGQVEQNLKEVLGADRFVGVRPGWFDSNARRWARQIVEEGGVTIPFPGAIMDWSATEDIGAVCAALLANGEQPPGQDTVLISGPQQMSLEDGVKAIGKALGKPLTVTGIYDEEEGVQTMVKTDHLPEGMARQLVSIFKKAASGDVLYTDEEHAVIRKNIEKYSGRPSMTVYQWAQKHKHEFGG